MTVDSTTSPEEHRGDGPGDLTGADGSTESAASADGSTNAKYTAVELVLDEGSNVLSAVLVEAATDPAISLVSLQEQIREAGYDEFLFVTDALNQVLSRVSRNERGTIPIAARKDAEVEIEFSDNDMVAHITTTAPYGGKPLSAGRLDEAISAADVMRELCDVAALEKVLTSKSVTQLKFAEGRLPRAGVDAQFIQLIDVEVEHGPTIDESGTANQYELHDFTVVDIGTPLMRRIPATTGMAGSDAKGKPVPAKAGKDYNFAKDNPGAMPSPEDPNTLIAEIKGHPVFGKTGVRVDNMLRLDHVDLRTGNISFDGSLTINGDITAGTEVAVTGDIEVKGLIVNATVCAGNDIIVRGGIIGPEPDEDEDETHATRVTAGGNVEALFASQASIEVEGDLLIKEYISYCEVSALGEARVGQQGGHGFIFGGHCHADGGIAANALGTDANVVTLVTAGYPAELIADYDALCQERDLIAYKSDQLAAVLEDLRCVDSPDENKIDVVDITVAAQRKKVSVITEKLDEIDRRRESAEGATITSRGPIYPNVTIGISEAQLTMKQQSSGGCFEKDGNDLKIKD